MTFTFDGMKNAALASIEDWAQNNKHLETMQIRVGDFIDMIYNRAPTDSSLYCQLLVEGMRAGIAQGLAISISEKIPEDRFGDVLQALSDIVISKIRQQKASSSTQPNNH